MNVLIVGYGSIGERHAQILDRLGHETRVVTARTDAEFHSYTQLSEALADFTPGYVVIANETEHHHRMLRDLKAHGYSGRLLVEKPIFSSTSYRNCIPCPGYVGYNLRLHPVLQELKRRTADSRILSTHIYVGSYLPDWRPNRDYRLCSSSADPVSGGVLKELSHDLDYLLWLTGRWRSVAAWGGKVSDFEMQAPDVYGCVVRTRRCPVATVQLNYFDRIGRREVVLNSERTSFHADLLRNELKINGEDLSFRVDRNDTYREMHESILNDRSEDLCSLQQGIEVLSLVEAAEKSAQEGRFVENQAPLS